MIYFSIPAYKYGSAKTDLLPIAEKFGKDATFLENRIGTNSLFTFSNEDEILTAVFELVESSLLSSQIDKNDIAAVFCIGQNRLQTCIPHFSSLIHNS